MTSRTRTLLLAALVALLAGGWLYLNVLAPTLSPDPTPTKVAKSPKKKPRKSKPATVKTAEEPPATPAEPAPVQTPSAPDPQAFGYRGLLFMQFDANGDRYLDQDELPELYGEIFLAHDRDSSGKIDVVEFDAAIEAGADLPDREVAQNPKQVLLTPPPSGETIPVYTPKQETESSIPEWFRSRDKDGDGQLGIYEWPAGAIAEFEKYDANGDGFITATEVEQDGRSSRQKSEDAKRPAGSSRSNSKEKP